MTSAEPGEALKGGLPTTDEDRRRRHADAQARYRARQAPPISFVHIDLIAPQKFNRHSYEGSIAHGAVLRARIEMSEEESRLAAQRRRRVDADYRAARSWVARMLLARANVSILRKFIAKFGHRAFMEQYLPLHQVFGDHITGKRFVWDDEKKKKKKLGRKPSTAAGTSKTSS
ncbi:hypothetical protein B0H11DRAFT_2229121 [Mycena galericulata]|nr:hypothetical protein B0H11DRAFT_2229121 [Mycena galericulata]